MVANFEMATEKGKNETDRSTGRQADIQKIDYGYQVQIENRQTDITDSSGRFEATVGRRVGYLLYI